jgi:diguanylate cyclase (GGDEF)-like protein
MAERRKASRRKDDNEAAVSADPVTAIMTSLLPVHAAMTTEWLVDAACTAAERGLNASYTFVFFEDNDGRLDPRAPASDLRRRSLQRASDAFGLDIVRMKISPDDVPAIAEALDTRSTVNATVAEVFGGLIGNAEATAAAKKLGTESATIVPLETAGERLGALVMLSHQPPNPEHARLLGDHISCAAVNLRQTTAAREQGVIDVVRSVFDARKLESELQRELSRADRYRHQASIVVIEATNLRLLREQFGSFLTDRLLQILGEELAEQSRDIDVIGAYKESGYAMILTEATTDGAANAAERLLAAAQKIHLDSSDVPGLELHLVTGYATFPADGRTTDALLATVERRMYGGAEMQAAS